MMTDDPALPQLEDGYTRLSNGLLEAMCRAGFNARQWTVLMAVARKTYGYGKKSDDISLTQLAKMTGIAKSHVSSTVASLVAANVLKRSAGTFGFTLAINKRPAQWNLRAAAKIAPARAHAGGPGGVTESGTGVTDLVTTMGVTDSVTGVTEKGTLEGVTDLATGDSGTTKGNYTKERKHTP